MDSFNLRSFREAYEAIYCEQENIFEDIVDFCLSANIFETVEETEYFANLIIENDLVETFANDVFEYCELLDESYIIEVSASSIAKGLKLAGGLFKKAAPAARGLSSKTMVKQGLRPTGLSSKGKPLSGAAKSDDIARTQAARAERKPPAPATANKYGQMLSAKKAAAPKPAAAPKSGGMTPSYVAKRGVTDTLATTLALGMGHMAGLKPATNVLKQFAQPIVRTVKSVAQKAPTLAPSATKTTKKATGAATDPWMQFPKTRPQQKGLPKEGPSSRLPNRTLPGSPTPKALPSAGQTSAPKAQKPTFKPEALPKTPKASQPGGALVPTRGPKPTFKPEALPKTTPGTVQRSINTPPSRTSTSAKTSKKTPTPSSGGSKSGGGLTYTTRAVLSPAEKTGNMRYPGLEKYATGSGPGTGGAKPPKKSRLGPIAAGLGAIAAGASVSQNSSENKNKKPSGKVSNIEKPKKTVAGEDVRKSFDTAFATERKLKGSKGTFRWTDPSSGKSGTYTTKLRGESVDNFDLILDALLIEGYSNAEALKIMSTLDEAAVTSLLLKLQKVLPKLSSKGKKLASSIMKKQDSTAADLERQKMAPVRKQQTKQRQERETEDRYGHPSLSARERNSSMR